MPQSRPDEQSPVPSSAPQVQRHMSAIDTLADGVFSGLIGASIVALWFLALDTLYREALFTPSLVGNELIRGVPAGAEHVVEMSMVAAYTSIHCVVFVVFGVLAAWVVDRFETPPDLPPLALVCFFALEGGFVIGTRLLVPGVAETLGHAAIAVGNVLAAVGMAVALRAWERQARGLVAQPAPAETGS